MHLSSCAQPERIPHHGWNSSHSPSRVLCEISQGVLPTKMTSSLDSFDLILPWFSYDFPMIFHEFPMICHDFSNEFPRLSSDFLMIFQWFSMSFQWWSYIVSPKNESKCRPRNPPERSRSEWSPLRSRLDLAEKEHQWRSSRDIIYIYNIMIYL